MGVLSALLSATLLFQGEAGCAAPSGSQGLLDDAADRILVIGELHGTEQAPEFLDALTCLSLERGETVAVGVEIPADDQDAIDAYLESSGDGEARAALLSSPFWASDDGRSSAAQLELLDALRLRRQDGQPVSVKALDFGSGDVDLLEDYDQASARDRAMARHAREAAETADRVLVLVGNIHARRTRLEGDDFVAESIGSVTEGDDFFFVRTTYGPGEAWNCIMVDEELSCGVHPRPGRSRTDAPRVLERDAADESPQRTYDAYVYLGETTASRPARRVYGIEPE